MEFIIDFLFEVIVEGATELCKSKRVPMPIRILAMLVCFCIFGIIAGVVYTSGYTFLSEGNNAVAITFFVIGSFLVIAFFYIIYKQFKERDEKKTQTITEQICEAKSNNLKKIKVVCLVLTILIISGVGLTYLYL